MRKTILGFILGFALLISSSCGIPGGSRTGRLNRADEEKLATARLEEILEAIKNKDSDVLENMFSEQARSEIDHLDQGIEYLFGLFNEEVESWEKIGGSVDTSNSHGQITTTYNYRFYVSTSSEKYLFSISACTKDADHPENIGMTDLLVFNTREEEPLFYGPGIYMPPEETQGAEETSSEAQSTPAQPAAHMQAASSF